MGAAKKLEDRPNIYTYHDYRTFLTDYFAYLKLHNPKFSLRALAKQVGVSPSYFTMVFRGDAIISDRVVELLDKPLGLTAHEVQFFVRLVHLIEARSLAEQKEAFSKITKFDNYRAKQSTGILAHQYISKWYYVAIRELAKQPDFVADEQWIKKNLEKKVSTGEVREALNFLIKFGFIVKKDDGTFVDADQNIKCEGSLYRLALTEFYRQAYDLCLESIYNTPREERYLTSRTMSVSEEGFGEIQAILTEAIEKLQEVTNKESRRQNKKRVYHVSLASFPMSKKRMRK